MSDTDAKHVIIYCDAGYLHQQRISGMGIHGYLYLKEEPKKGTGNPKAVPTEDGYLIGSESAKKVTITQYIDIASGSRNLLSNNEAELKAFLMAMQWIDKNPNLISAKVFTDSKFVVIGTTTWLSKWEDRGWRTGNGEPVKYIPTWKAVKELYDKLCGRLEVFDVKWIKGHNGHIGNEIADALAGKGLVLGHNSDTEVYEKQSDAQGYWTRKIEIPRILQSPRWYFTTGETRADLTDPKGRIKYYIGTHGTKDKEDDLPGKRYADNFLATVRMSVPDPVMESLRDLMIEKDSKRYNRMVIGYLDNIFNPKTYAEIQEHGTRFMLEDTTRLEISNSKKVPVLVELNPIGLGFRQIDLWNVLDKVLDEVQEGAPGYCITDITDNLYEAPDKKGNRKLKASISQVTKYIDQKVTYNLEKVGDEPKPFETKTRLILGSDILTRNQLSALGNEIEAVKVVTWRMSDLVGRYATLIELKNGDVGLWARVEANIMYRS